MKKILVFFTLAVAALGLTNLAHAATANPVLDDYVAVSEALVKDDLPAAKKAAATLAETAKTTTEPVMAVQAAKVASASSLESAREHFKAASEEAKKLATGREGYFVLTCPMAKADWVQKTKDVRNPYMGQSMPSCGFLKSQKTGSIPQTTSMGGCCG